MFKLLLGAMTGAAMLLTAAAQAAWPEKPVRLIVPYPAGGSSDLPARIYAEGLQRRFGKPFVVENRVGAAGTIGAEAAVRATPDGYTIYCGPNSPMVLLPFIRKVNYQPTDLIPIAAYGEVVYAFGVLSTMKEVNNLKDLQAYAKANPGKLTYSSPGSGSATNLRGEAFKSLAGVDIVHIPYRTGAEALPDLLAGRLDIMLDNIFLPQVRIGTVKMLGVLADRRHPEFPDVPTFAEQGFPIELRVWGGFHAPVGTPDEVIESLGKAVNELNVQPDIIERQIKIGWVPFVKSPAELRRQMTAEIETYKEWVRKTNFRID
ncbi:MAG: Bug family tripartite tricarboxylate transporter substrate binding protein [Acetobacteraceae bacterium]